MDVYYEATMKLPHDQIDHYRSDLYILMSHRSRPIIEKFRKSGGSVEETLDEESGFYWYYIPFGYTPYWQRNYRAIIETLAWEFIAKNERRGSLYNWSDENMCRTYADHKAPPHRNTYPAIKKTLEEILNYYDVPQENLENAS